MELGIRPLPRLCWVAFIVLLVVYITCYGYGFHRLKAEKSVLYLSFHYLFMSLAWPVCMTEAVLSYRAPLIPFKQRSSIKYLHVTLQSLVGVFIVLGLAMSVSFHVYSKERHFYSLHSWIGILAIAIYFAQYAGGFYAYIASSWEPARKAAFYGVHRPLGLLGLLSGLLAVLLGLCESQMYIIASGGLVSFTTSAAYAAGSIMQPVLGVILFLQAIAVVAAVTLRKQYLPAPGASTKEAALP